MLATGARPISLELTPWEVVSRLCSFPELVFFDTAASGRGKEQLSIIAVSPRTILTGRSDEDWKRLAGAVQSWSAPNRVDAALPNGFAAGCVDYDRSFRFGFYPDLLVYRHSDSSWHAIGNPPQVEAFTESKRAEARGAPVFGAEMSPDAYCSIVSRAQEYIGAGDIYQVNLARRFAAPWNGEPFAFYESLRRHSPAPYAAFLRNGSRTILCSSPELFLRFSGRHVVTRPIKGTRPRAANCMADEKSANELVTSPKENAELVMITDLERNDLGIVCEYGSVTVSELVIMERFEQVFHLVSTVEGILKPEFDHVTAFSRCFPGGSITGAPKKRAMEIIAQLEPIPRGVYTGAIGYFGFNGESQFSIAIRTVVAENETLHFHTGAGIVADSVPEREYEETLHKAAGIFLAAERM